VEMSSIHDTEKKLFSADEFIFSFQSLEMATASFYVSNFALRIHDQ